MPAASCRSRTRSRARHEAGTEMARRRSGSAVILDPMANPPGQRLLRYDRRLGVRFVAGADEAGRGSLAGPLVVAGVLLDYERLQDHRVRPLGFLNDSKQCSPERREALYRAVLGCADKVAVRVIPAR